MLICITLLGQSADAMLTSWSHEVGISAGVGHYFGDLNTEFDITRPGKAISVFSRNSFNKRMSIKTQLTYMEVAYDDKYNQDAFKRRRNLNFFSPIVELSSQFELNFLDLFYYTYNSYNASPISPYLFLGVGAFAFRPQTEYLGQTYDLQPLGTEGQNFPSYSGIDRYSLVSFFMKYGLGLKYQFARNFALNLEFDIRRTYTDYLDDVSGYYPEVLNLDENQYGLPYLLYDRSYETGARIGLPGRQRGSNKSNDDYASFMIGFSWKWNQARCKINY
jgi:hypothetical protein